MEALNWELRLQWTSGSNPIWDFRICSKTSSSNRTSLKRVSIQGITSIQ